MEKELFDVEAVYIIFHIAITFFLGLYIKNFFPSYMDKKGENLATKEDIAEITRKTEEVQKEFKEGFELFSSDVQFKYDFYFKQYSELYSKLYGIIMQSEYARHFVKLDKDQEESFEKVPFVEISPTHKFTKSVKWDDNGSAQITQKEEIIDTPLSNFNKKELCECIVENAEYATQKLLKIAIAYRFAYSFYAGNPDAKNSDCQKTANDEEFRLIREMVCCIVSEYNFFRKELKMEYNEEELNTGIPQL